MRPFFKKRRDVWELHQIASLYHCRPSDLLHIDDEWAALQFDRAVARFAWHVEDQMAHKVSLLSLLSDPDDTTTAYADFRTLARKPVRKVKINPDGTW